VDSGETEACKHLCVMGKSRDEWKEGCNLFQPYVEKRTERIELEERPTWRLRCGGDGSQPSCLSIHETHVGTKRKQVREDKLHGGGDFGKQEAAAEDKLRFLSWAKAMLYPSSNWSGVQAGPGSYCYRQLHAGIPPRSHSADNWEITGSQVVRNRFQILFMVILTENLRFIVKFFSRGRLRAFSLVKTISAPYVHTSVHASVNLF
jgi:hypothetical protein